MALAPAHLDPAQRNPEHPWSKLAIHRVSATWFTFAGLMSYFTLALAVLKGAPEWLYLLEALVPWALLFIFAPLVASSPEERSAFKADNWYNKLELHTVPVTYILAASAASFIIVALSLLQGLPVWLSFGLCLAPWGMIILLELEWVYAHFGWFALFATMATVQTIHYSEHIIEVIQFHIFHQSLAQSIAIFSTLNIELVHFTGDTFLTIGTLLLLTRFPRNPWLWVALPFQIAHQAEHTYLTYNYLFGYDKAGGVGLLASPGGAIGGGIGLNRPDLHFFYNTLYTIPFVIALIYQAKHVYDRNLQQAFPDLSTSQLIGVGKHLETFHYAAGETILAPGDTSDRLYIITDGEATVYRHDESGREVEVASLHKGQYFGEIGLLVPDAPHTKTIRATSNLAVLAMDQETFEHVTAMSKMTAEHLDEIAHERMVAQPAVTS